MISKIKKAFARKKEVPEYVEIDVGKEIKKEKLLIKPFVLKDYEDINKAINALREGNCIVLIDIKKLKQKDIVELKRAIAKLKKTVEALEGSIAGFSENVIIATPPYVEIYRPTKIEKVERVE